MIEDGKSVERKFRRYEIPLLIGLIITWVALWREISVFSIASGIVVALVVTRGFYLPPVEIAASFNPLYVLAFAGFLLYNLAKASLQVAWIAVSPRRVPNSSIIKVALRSNSDFILTATGLTISVIPGSFIVDVDRHSQTLYLHVLGAKDDAAITKMVAEVAKVERLLVLAVGNSSDKELVK